MKTIFLTGTITTVSPVSIALPDTKGMSKSSQGLPMLSAGTIRGWLRHSAHEAIAMARHEAGKNLTVDQHYMLSTGVDTARVIKEAQATKIGANAAIRKANPVLSLFGRWGLAGRLSVGSAVAQDANCLITLGNGSRSHVFNRNPALTDFVDGDQLDYLQEILMADSAFVKTAEQFKAEEKALKRELKGATVERKAEINARLVELTELIDGAKESRTGAKESIQRPLERFEAIDAGHTLTHRMTLANPTDEEFHLLLWSILIASSQPVIGGHRNLGCGMIHAEWSVSERTLGDAQAKVIGTVGFNDSGFYCDIAGFNGSAMTEAFKAGTIQVTDFV